VPKVRAAANRLASTDCKKETEKRPQNEVLTFSVDDATLGQIVWRKFHANFVAGNNSNEIPSNFACDMRKDFIASFQLDPESGVGKSLGDGTVNFVRFFFWHMVFDGIPSRQRVFPVKQCGKAPLKPQIICPSCHLRLPAERFRCSIRFASSWEPSSGPEFLAPSQKWQQGHPTLP